MKNFLTLIGANVPTAAVCTAKMPQNTGGGNSQCLTLRSIGAQYFTRFLGSSCRVWKYVACMLMVLFMGVGNVWGALSTHQPGVYSKAAAQGGYGQTLTTYGERQYEIFGFTKTSSSAFYCYAGSVSSNTSDANCILSFNKTSVSSGEWLSALAYGNGSSQTSAMGNSYDQFSTIGGTNGTAMYFRAGSSLTIKISGYDRFSLAAKDANTTTKHLTVTIDGEEAEMTLNTNTSIRDFNLSTGEHTIVVGAVNTSGSSDSNSQIYAFSLRIPSSGCTAPTNATITANPANAEYTAGDNISLTASATGTTSGTTTYTWYKGAVGDNWATVSATTPIQSASTSGSSYTKNSCATSDAGVYWCNISNGTGCEVQVSKTITVAAAPVANPTITGAVNEEGWGSVSPASITVSNGDAVSIAGAVLTCGEKTLTATATTATAEYTYTFVNWTGVSNGDEITANTTATANFSRTANSYDVNYTAPTNGSYTIKVGDASAVSENTTAAYGTTVTLAATPASGYRLAGWTVAKAAGSVSVTNNQFTMPAEAVTVSAEFEQVCYLVLYDLVNGIGSEAFKAQGDKASITANTSIIIANTDDRVVLKPKSGEKFKNGDVMSLAGKTGKANKNFGVHVYIDNDATKIGTISTTGNTEATSISGALVLSKDVDSLIIRRDGGTTQTITSCVIKREITCPEELGAITGLAVDGTATTASSLTFTWTAVENASSYDVYLYSDENCETLVGEKANVATTSKAFTGLTPETPYYCKVQAIGDGVSYTDGPLSAKASGTTSAAPTFDVTYENGGHGTAPSAAPGVAYVDLPQIAAVTGYAHTAWTADKDVTVDAATVTAGTEIAIGKRAFVSANTIFTAVWANTYTLTLDPKGGTIADATGWTLNGSTYEKVVTSGEEVELPTFTKAERTFKTWRKAGPADVESPVTVTGDLTLTAVWNATVEQVIYSWEGAEGGAIEFGGTAVGSETGLVNTLSEGYYCLRMNGNTSYDKYVEITLSGDEKIKTGDKITYLGFYSNASDKNASPKMRDSNGSKAEIFADSENLPKINGGVGTPAQRTFTVPEGINTNKVQMTRTQTGASTMMPKIRIYREVTTEEDNIKTVTFNSNGGSDVAAAEVISGKVVAKPADPTKSHYRFNEWQLSGSAYDFSAAVTEDITLVADWTQLYAVTYAAGEGSGLMAAAEAAQGDKVTLKANGFTAPTGKVFDAWVVTKTVSGAAVEVTAGKFTMPAEAVTVTATWKATYTVNYIDEDGTTPLGSEEVAVGSHPTASEIDAKKDFKILTWLQSSVAVELDEVSAAAGETVELVASYAPAYASSINIEQWVLNNRKNNTAFRAALDAQYYKYVDLDNLDSLTVEKNETDRNYPFLGLKVKKETSAISFLLKAGSTVRAKFGNVGNDVNMIIGDADPVAKTAAQLATPYEYENTSGADVVVKFQSTGTSTVVFKQIMIDEAIATVKLPAVVTYDANGGTFDKTTEKYTGTPLVIGDATPADAEHIFEGWHVGTVEGAKIDASAYVPTKNVTLVAKYVVKPSPFSLSVLTYQIGTGAETAVGYVEGTYEYEVKLPYAPSYETITVAYTLADGTSSTKAGAVLSVTSVPGAATFTVVAANETEKTYTVNFKKAAKDGVEIIGAVVTGDETADVSGLYKGTASVKLNSKKIDNGDYYIYVTLKEGYTFQDGDVLVVDVNAKSDLNGGTKALEISTGEGNLDNGILISLAVDEYSTGENTIVLSSVPAGATSIGLKRSSNQNAKINGLKVYRPMNPVLKSITFDGTKIEVAGTAVEETLPYATDLNAVTAEYYWNGAGTAVVTTNEGAWVWGDNTYVLTDKDGDATTYAITLVRAARSSDKSLSSLTVDGNAIELKDGVYDYTYEYPYGTDPATVPAVAAEANDAHASVGTITQAGSTAGTASFTVTAEDESEQEYTVSFKISRVPGLVIYDGSTGATAFTATSYEDDDTHFAWSIGSSISVSADNAPASSTWGGKTYTKILKGFKPKNGNNEVSFTVPSGYLAKIRLVGSTNSDGNERKMFIAEEATSDASKAIGNYVITSSTYEAQGLVTELLMPGTYYLGSTDTYRLFEFSAQLYPIDYSREVNPQYYGTICLPKAGVIAGATLFELAYMDYKENKPYKVYYDEVLNGELEAGMPYIFLAHESTIGVFYTDDAEETAKDKNGLHGTLEDITSGMNGENKYMLYNNQVLHSTSPESMLPANRAYIQLNEVDGYNNPNYHAAPAKPGRRRISTGFNAPQIATGLEDAAANEKPVKVLINGELYILRGEKMYDATGRLVK